MSGSPPTTLERRVVAASMIGAPLLLLAGALLHAPHAGSTDSWLASAEAGPGRFYAAHLLFLLGVALFVPAVLCLGRLLHHHQPALTALGMVTSMLGIVGIAGLVGSDFVVSKMASPAADRAEMVALLDRVTGDPGFFVPLFGLAGGIAAGPALLALALHRERAVPAWAAVAIAAGAPAFLFGIPLRALPILAAASLLAGFAATARALPTADRGAASIPPRNRPGGQDLARAAAPIAGMRS